MDLVKITDLTPQLGLTSRSLRYYEEAGLIQSVRLPGEKYRYFDAANIERLKQIIVLRKMMVTIKDILRIYESDDMSVVVQVFVSRIEEIDREAAALTELRQVTDDFLKTMVKTVSGTSPPYRSFMKPSATRNWNRWMRVKITLYPTTNCLRSQKIWQSPWSLRFCSCLPCVPCHHT